MLFLPIRQFCNMAKGGFYAVKVGRRPGVYLTWAECEAQVKGFQNAKYKKFPSRADAQNFIDAVENKSNNEPARKTTVQTLEQKTICTTTFPTGKRKLLHVYEDQDSSKESINAQIPKLENVNDFSFQLLKYNDVPKIEVDANFKTSLKEEQQSKMVHVYTDGACSDNGFSGAKAGIGVFWGPDHPLNTSMKLEGRPTNNRAEIHAAAYALNQAKAYGFKEITLHTDSQFLINGITKWITNWKKNGWKLANGKPVINKEDFETLEKATEGINITWEYVPGHKGDPGNEAADKLAVLGTTSE